jgi:hypothetical protein
VPFVKAKAQGLLFGKNAAAARRGISYRIYYFPYEITINQADSGVNKKLLISNPERAFHIFLDIA